MMPLNNSLRSIIAQSRNFSTRSRGNFSSPRRSRGSKRAERIVYVGVEFKNFVPSVMNGFYAFCALETIQVFEYLRTMERDLRERFPEVEVQQDPLFVSSPQLPAAAADAAIYVRLVAATTCGKTQPPAVTKRTCSL
ncbi:hypothetical protein AT3G11165 [Arabidopsis thaliana]|uniref:Uncharacterized protein n=1 Tax=Arabidopsis thaliana TaxID=3702 RepID=A0A1I9LR88_ARATH|nr:uncharacterized protein AT3G11165 [Arabidopsis thaliana]ANM65096.1 hypothetical protein AT3G11165 [Arabidopsis thaliana]|eukprot:NP_001327091.1 hypothetical protein AT3G11165 [Arabidopsis thaliana]